jgi:phosphatidylethanolamine-binding protein (PEBP) family uncharacterized protein
VNDPCKIVGLVIVLTLGATACGSSADDAGPEESAGTTSSTAARATTAPSEATTIATTTDAPATTTSLPATTSTTTTAEPFALSSGAFVDGGSIPVEYSCDGADISPDLNWRATPDGTQSLALVMGDPDAVPIADFVFDHWVAFNLPAEMTGLA